MPLPTPRLLVAGALAAAVAAALVPHAAQAGPAAPQVPADIAPPAGHKPYLVGHAAGVQTYSCRTLAGGFAWGPGVPAADLHDDNGKLIARHFAGPSWQAKDGSTVIGSRVDGESVDPTALPWLLLSATSAMAGPDGDRLAGTTYIQRVATTDGLPPAADRCNAETAGDAVDVPYTADYVFWKAWSG
jgi:Protein of unknown function (DUF3455)